MKTSIIFFLIMILAISLFGADIALADNNELTELEAQQLKILKLSKVVEEQPSNIKQKEDIESYKIGLELYRQSNYQQAISELLKVEYSTLNLPLYIKSQYILGDCYRRVEDWDRAIEIYKNLVVNDPILTDYSLFHLAETYRLKGENRESAATYKQIIENFPQSLIISEANYRIAQNYHELNDTASAVVYYKNILEDSKDNQLKAKVLLELSEIYWQEKKYVDSLNCLYEILDEGCRLKRNSEPEELLVRYLYKIQEDLKEIEVPYHIMVKCADILFKYRQYNIAEDLYEKVTKTFPEAPDIAEVYYKRARALYYKKEYKEAINQCEEIITKFPSAEITIKANYLGGNSLRALGERYLAIDKYEKIIEQYPESYYARQSYLRLAESYFQLKETEKGISLWRELISRYPNSYESMTSLWNLARHYTNNNSDSEALDYYRELSERFSQSRLGDDALYWKGKILENIGSDEEAKIAYEKLVRDYPLSYYTERIIEQRGDISFTWPVSISRKEDFINLEEFLKKYDKIEGKGQLSLLKAELFEEISFYKESIVELKGALNHNSGNIFLLFKLSDVYKKNMDYNDSLNYSEIIFNYLEDNHQLEELPLELWQSLYPVYYEDAIRERALEYKIDPLLVLAMIREESRFNSWNESVAGARGLMQIIFSTGEWIAQKLNLEDFNDEMLFDPEVNIDLGCWYINYLKERFLNDPILIISGYNAGPGTTSKWLKEYDRSDLDNFVENLPYSETREHIKKVTKSYQMYKRLAQVLSEE
ncbi:MAG: tetratricopeptide repeat protein [Candidatus Caldatribacteriota bacterium]|nr:tetratricopeptide repeat protein [Candidatus Caldatribacteriota bacterium]